MSDRRMTASEREGMLRIFAGLDAFEAGLEKLGRRTEGIKYSKGTLGMLRKLVRDVTDTVPTEQRDGLLRNSKHLVWDIYVKGPVKRDKSTEDGVYIPYGLLEEVSKHTKEVCLMCGKDPQEQRKCAMRRFYDLLPIENVDEEDPKRCPYAGGLY